MGSVKVYYDKEGNTLTVWFDDPNRESVAEEIGDDIVVIKDRKGRVIGFEKLNYVLPRQKSPQNLPVEVVV